MQSVPGPTAVSALEIMVAPRLQRHSGTAQAMLKALRDNVRRLGFTTLYAPRSVPPTSIVSR